MEQKLQELTEKIYAEGVEKGENRAKEIIKEAESRAAKIIADAKKAAEDLRAAAQSEAEELLRKSESEIRLSSRQAMSAFRQSLTEAVAARVLDENVKRSLSDGALLREIIRSLIQKWDAFSAKAPALEVLLPEEKRAELEAAFKGEALKELSKGMTVTFSDAVKNGFKIAPKDGGFRIDFSEQDFIEFFKHYLRPKTREFLFKE
jgi:V/A-type H+/Na+-transporting ATPase subunit E